MKPNYLTKAKRLRPQIAERQREGGDRIEAQCPACGAHRPAFCITELDNAQAAAIGHAWACDGCISHLIRLEQANA